MKIQRKLQYLGIVVMALFMTVAQTGNSYAFLWHDVEITPRVVTSGRYDSNITSVKTDPKSDWITELLVGLALRREGKHNFMTMDVNIARQVYLQNTEFSNTSAAMSLRYTQDLSKHDVISVTENLSRSEEARSFEDAFGRTNGHYFTLNNSFAIDYRHDFSQQMSWRLHYANALADYSRDDLSDSSMNTIGTGLDYALSSANIVSLNYEWSQRKFSPGPSATVNELSLNARHFFNSQLYLDMQTGVDLIRSFNGQEYTKPLFRVSLTKDIDENTRTGISFEKKYTTTSYTESLLDNWRISANYQRQLTSRILMTTNAFYGEGTYLTSNIKDKLIGATLGFIYDLTRNSTLNISYSFSQDTSSEADSGYMKNVLYFGITIKF